MNCPKCHSYVSSGICKLCNEVIIEKKAKSKVIAKRSNKKQIEDRVYTVLRKRFLEERPQCEVFPHLKSEEVHHKAGRNGSNYLDTNTWASVSRVGHLWIHGSPAEAKEKGFMLTRSI